VKILDLFFNLLDFVPALIDIRNNIKCRRLKFFDFKNNKAIKNKIK